MSDKDFPLSHYQETKCKACDSCYRYRLDNKCIYGGPFRFVDSEGKKIECPVNS
jgi:hypothetical protein